MIFTDTKKYIRSLYCFQEKTSMINIFQGFPWFPAFLPRESRLLEVQFFLNSTFFNHDDRMTSIASVRKLGGFSYFPPSFYLTCNQGVRV